MSEQRPTGFYWVRFSDVDWEPALWNGFWLAIGSSEDASDRVLEVGERIERKATEAKKQIWKDVYEAPRSAGPEQSLEDLWSRYGR